MTRLALTPWILVDLSRNRIRIPKITLRSLNKPEFIRLLINPETRSLAIETCDQSEPRKHRITAHAMASRNSYEICSTSLCDQLRVHANWVEGGRYKMFASAQAGNQLLLFKFDDAIPSIAGILMPDFDGKRAIYEVQAATGFGV